MTISPKSTFAVSIYILLILLSVSVVNALTIDEAVALALKQNKSYKIAQAQKDDAAAEVRSAYASALPHLDFSSSLQRNFEIPSIVFAGESFKLGTDNNLAVNLTLTQTIYRGGQVLSAVKIARLYRQYIDAMVNEAEAEVSFVTRRTFLAAVLADDFVKVYEDAVAAAELNLDITTKMFEQGVISDYERLRAEVELANLKPQLSEARNLRILVRDNLKTVMGATLDEKFELQYDFDSSLVGQELAPEYLQELALESRAAIKEKENLTEMSRHAIGLAKSGQRPEISLESRLGWSYQADDFGFADENWSRNLSASLLVSMPIFDGFATSGRVQKARVRHRSTSLELERLKDQVTLAVNSAYLSYSEVSERLAAQSKTVQQAEEGLRIAHLRYEGGIGTQLEVLSAESALTLARTNYVRATHDAALAVYRLVRETGVDHFADLKEK